MTTSRCPPAATANTTATVRWLDLGDRIELERSSREGTPYRTRQEREAKIERRDRISIDPYNRRRKEKQNRRNEKRSKTGAFMEDQTEAREAQEEREEREKKEAGIEDGKKTRFVSKLKIYDFYDTLAAGRELLAEEKKDEMDVCCPAIATKGWGR